MELSEDDKKMILGLIEIAWKAGAVRTPADSDLLKALATKIQKGN